MAIVQIRIGSADNIHQYDDGDYDSAIETLQPIKTGAPVDSNDVIRLEDLEGRLLNPVSVANIDNPTELNSIEGVLGALILAYEPLGATVLNEFTLYAYDISGPAVNAPYIMDADGASDQRWIAVGGKYSIYGTGTDLVDGPAASTDNAIARFDGVTGLLLQNSLVTIDDSGNIVTPEYIRKGKIWHAYGGFQDESETISIAAVDTWTMITNAANDLWNGIESDGLTLTDDEMTITNAGDYVGSLSMTFSGLNGKDFQIRLYNITQAVQMGYVIGASTTGVNNFTNVTLPLYIEVDAGDELRMEVQCTTDGSDPIFRSAVFYLSYLHD